MMTNQNLTFKSHHYSYFNRAFVSVEVGPAFHRRGPLGGRRYYMSVHLKDLSSSNFLLSPVFGVLPSFLCLVRVLCLPLCYA